MAGGGHTSAQVVEVLLKALENDKRLIVPGLQNKLTAMTASRLPKSLGTRLTAMILKKMRLSKYYEHTSFILNRLTGKETVTLSPALVEQLTTMFKQIQGPFVRHAPRSRTNFMSYTFVLHKQLQLLGRDDLLPLFPLLKSRDKLRQQDIIWQKICEDPSVRWEFVPSL